MRKKALFFKIMNSDQFGHGGQKRSYQLDELVSKHYDIDVIMFDRSNNPPFYTRKEKLRAYVRYYKKKWYKELLTDTKRRPWFNREVCRMYNIDTLLTDNIDKIKSADIFIWEASFPYYLYFPVLLKQYSDKKVFALPHNLESLVKNQHLHWYSDQKSLQLEQELNALQKCYEVFTISEEEQWLLNLFDIPARYLPYYVSDSFMPEMLSIRAKREETPAAEKDFYFILGSAINPPTKLAMKDLLLYLQKQYANKSQKFKIAGFGTEIFLADFNSESIEIIGKISQDDLQKYLSSCKGVIIASGFTSGVVTRIHELLLAGVPVICDEGSVRSNKRANGVYVYADYKELPQILSSRLDMPSVPQKPTRNIDYFLERINQA